MIDNSTYRYKHIRGPQRHVKRTRSTTQIKRSKSFRTCCTYWSNKLTPSDQLLWHITSKQTDTAFNYFLRINLARAFNDLPLLTTPPPDF